MKEHDTFPGKPYVVTCKAGCDITDASGELDETCEPGKQKIVYAPSEKLFTSENAVVRETFNRAAAVLRLLGGGVKSELPAGYLRAEFLESTGTQYIDTGIVAADFVGVELEAIQTEQRNDSSLCGAAEEINGLATRYYAWLMQRNGGGKFYVGWNGALLGAESFLGRRTLVRLNYNNSRVFEALSGEKKETINLTEPLREMHTTLPLFASRKNDILWNTFLGKLFSARISAPTPARFKPALFAGRPCLFETVGKSPFFNIGTGQFIVGFTLAQARKLGAHLPAGGGALTISLPAGYEQDTAVADSLEEARAKGWTLTVQTYAAEAGASTFALRRIWVRKTQSEYGGYVDADGVRYSVEWCATMYTPDGSEPDAHGYEPFRSVEAAVEYWGLAPYVAPEAEEEFNTIDV